MGKLRTQRKSKVFYIFGEKFTVSSEISIRLVDRKKKEVNEPPNNHSYTKNIINHVNDDCLAAIFMYVPICERPKIALVCQKWKRALYHSWGSVKKIELTHWEYDEYPTCLKNYPTLDGQFRFLKTLLYKCGRYLTQLDLTAYGHCNIVPVINEYCSNLVELRLRFTYVDNEILFDAFSHLSKLKVLAVILQDFDDQFIPLNLIYSLRTLANTLTDLILLNWTEGGRWICNFPKETIGVIRELKALRRVDISGIKVTSDLVYYLNHEISLFAYHDDYFLFVKVYEIKNIRDLNLTSLIITDDGLYTIANNLKQLNMLAIDWRNVTNVGIVTISKMNLRILCCARRNTVIDSSSIILLKNLQKVGLSDIDIITDDLAIKVIENSPELTVFYIMHTSITVEFIKKAAEISRNRKQHLHLRVSLKCETKKYESSYLTVEFKAEV